MTPYYGTDVILNLCWQKMLLKGDAIKKPRVLFLCTGNSCRSQMAEGWCSHYWNDQYDIFSAGTQKHGLNPRAVQVMKESGVDISNHYSKTLEDIGTDFDYVFTVCGHANENCPWFPGKAKILHVGFDDPPKLTQGMSDEEEILEIYRRVRDEVESFIKKLRDYL